MSVKNVERKFSIISQTIQGNYFHMNVTFPNSESPHQFYVYLASVEKVEKNGNKYKLFFQNNDVQTMLIELNKSTRQVYIIVNFKDGERYTLSSTAESEKDFGSLQDTLKIFESRGGELLEEPYALGKGGYGCVVFPALVLPGSRLVGPSNRFEQATKIGRQKDMLEEYDLSQFIQNAVHDETLGIFAKELTCGVNVGDLGLYAKDIVKECSTILGTFPKPRYEQKSFKPSERIKIPVQKFISKPFEYNSSSLWLPSLQGGKVLCAVQQPRYQLDFKTIASNVQNRTVNLSISLADFIVDTLRNKLQTLHSHNIAHLDIKRENLACMVSQSNFAKDASLYRLADFGLSKVVTEKNYKAVYEKVFFGYYSDYLSKLTPDFFDFLGPFKDELSPEQQFQCGFWVDEFCLQSALSKLYLGPSEKIDAYVQQLKEKIQSTMRPKISVPKMDEKENIPASRISVPKMNEKKSIPAKVSPRENVSAKVSPRQNVPVPKVSPRKNVSVPKVSPRERQNISLPVPKMNHMKMYKIKIYEEDPHYGEYIVFFDNPRLYREIEQDSDVELRTQLEEIYESLVKSNEEFFETEKNKLLRPGFLGFVARDKREQWNKLKMYDEKMTLDQLVDLIKNTKNYSQYGRFFIFNIRGD